VRAEVILNSRGDYRAPERLTMDLNERRREEKIRMEEARLKLAQEVQYDMPKASK
jgi:hypothetical protein